METLKKRLFETVDSLIRSNEFIAINDGTSLDRQGAGVETSELSLNC